MTEATLIAENKRLQKWVSDLLSGMNINCVHCGHLYGPTDKVPVAMAEVLKQHIQQCPKHPMRAMRTALFNIIGRIETWQNTDPDSMDEQEVLDTTEETIQDVMALATAALKEAA